MKLQPLELLHRTDLPIVQKMKIERCYIKNIKSIKKILRIPDETASSFYPLVRNNRFYGDEELIRNYSNTNEDLYAIIEHGLYFGNNSSKVGNDFEWELGCILTSGDYRKNLISDFFPNYLCETIGPMIHYAKAEQTYKDDLRRKLVANRKTLLFFPVHGNEFFTPEYDTEQTLNKIIEIADRHDCYNIVVCVYYGNMNLFNHIANKLNNDRITITTCGNRYDSSFLMKQRAMIELSDITVSNNLGTHLGYCTYLGKPHILLPQNFSYIGNKTAIESDFGGSNRSNNWKSDFEKEKKRFQGLFNGDSEVITEEQRKLCDYYWGFSKVKSPAEIRTIYRSCREYSAEFVRGIYING